MQKEFSRTELLLGKPAMKKLASSRVAVFGAGGVGGYVIEAIIRSGIGEIDIIDPDKVSVTNINRQILALHSTIGEYKVDVAKDRALDINPNMKVNVYRTFFSEETSKEFDFTKYDYVVDAIDTVSGKIEIVMKAKAAKVPMISSMGAGNKLRADLFEVADIYKTSYCPLARVMRTELKKRGVESLKVVYSKELPQKHEGGSFPASISYVPSVVGLIIGGEVIKDLVSIL